MKILQRCEPHSGNIMVGERVFRDCRPRTNNEKTDWLGSDGRNQESEELRVKNEK